MYTFTKSNSSTVSNTKYHAGGRDSVRERTSNLMFTAMMMMMMMKLRAG
jgi:hypothetical protein